MVCAQPYRAIVRLAVIASWAAVAKWAVVGFDVRAAWAETPAAVTAANAPTVLVGKINFELDVMLSGRIENRRDVDVFSFEAKKEDSLLFQVESRVLGFPLDAVLKISGAFSGPIPIVAEATGASKLVHAAGAAIPGHAAQTNDLWLTVAAATGQ